MAHDVLFVNVDDSNDTSCFFGYAGGVFYREFGVEHFDYGRSGSGGSIVLGREEVFEIIYRIGEMKEIKEYPDPSRYPELVEKLKKSEASSWRIFFG